MAVEAPSKIVDAAAYFEAKLAYEYGPIGLKMAIENGEKLTIVDLRTPELFAKGHIPGAINLKFEELDKNLDKLSKDTIFTVVLPVELAPSLTAGAQDKGTSRGPREGEPAACGNVLLVEDNPVNQQVARLMLTRLGMNVTVAGNGEEALGTLTGTSADQFDIVLMDVQMPVMDGHEATRRLRAYEEEHGLPRKPVIALTSNVMAADREAAVEVGMDDFLSKPFAKSELEAVVRRWVGR